LKEGTIDQLLKEGEDKKIVEFTLKNQHVNTVVFNHDCSFSISWDTSLQRGKLEMEDLEKELPQFLSFLKREGLILQDMVTRQLSLDDLFISLTGRHLDE
jgi:ABC-2 type transport system ATP-binding protein